MKRNRGPTPKTSAKKVCSATESEKSGSGSSNNNGSNKETLQVYCRVRPLQDASDQSCIAVVPPNIIKVTSPDVNRDGNVKEIQYMFRGVFDQFTGQDEVFMSTTFNLVKGLLNGKNGLLMAYGLSGSGKTFTMNGTSLNYGIMPRCIEVLFNSIGVLNQARDFIFKPDKMNGFEIQSENDALKERQKSHIYTYKTASKLSKKEANNVVKQADSSTTSPVKINDINKNNLYGVFVTYVEVYNNAVYDLLEETSDDILRQRPLQPKMIREDANHNMYVHAVTEVEVTSYEEAFDVYFKGQRRKRLAGTALNVVSSRSHSVFTIRVVQAPLSVQNDLIPKERNILKVSQLLLVDLAGSERTSRTKTVGLRLREAGRINNSLLTLRTCLEILRENQSQGANKMVPYRESRLTHLFKNYLEGEGDIRMIICANPKTDDYEENLHVLKFSEMCQEVIVNRAPPAISKSEPQIGSTPSNRRIVNKFVTPKAESNIRMTPYKKRPVDEVRMSRFFRPCFPDMTVHVNLAQLISVIDARLQSSNELNDMINTIGDRLALSATGLESDIKSAREELHDFTNAANTAHSQILELEKKLSNVNNKNTEIHGKLSSAEAVVKNLESEKLVLQKRLMNANSEKNELNVKLMSAEGTKKGLENKVADKELQLNKEHFEALKERNRFRSRMLENKEKYTKEMEHKLHKQKSAMELEIIERDKKMQRVRRALETPTSCTAVIHGAPNHMKPSTPSIRSRVPSDSSSVPSSITPRSCGPIARSVPSTANFAPNVGSLDLATPGILSDRKPAAVSDPRHRRSRSAGGGDMWLDHRPLTAIQLNTIMQPVMKRRKSVTKLTDVKDVVNSKTSKYCLTTQTLDSDGDLETCLYKGDVVPTTGGGAQVLFNDMEVLHHKSPPTSPSKVRSPHNGPTTPRAVIEERCAVSVEGHSKF